MPASPSILRSKSAVQLLKLQNQRSMSGRTPSTSTSSEWLLRAGQAISSETRESKGQSWLVSRASSTSLVDRVEDEGEIGGWAADDEYSRAHSRIGSRFASRRGSTQGSREFVTPRENRLSRDGYFDLDMTTEPDFVDEEEIERRYLEEVLDEAEISQLTRQRGFGLGRWMDRLVGWSLFAVEEQDDESGAPHESTSTRLEENVRRKRREEGERIVLAERPPPAPEGRPGEGQAAGEGGWQDAAWLLSVASKVIL
ncbi:MAG: hypothetical protein M1814_003731 [Vezdaea aestivalis]|nr:MAG: hypothetical protein M1814_003731 [Vezdaea aestivalis]